MRLNLKIQQKIQLFIIGASIIIYAFALGYISIKVRQTSYNESIEKADNYVQQAATNLKALLDADMAKVKALADAFHIYDQYPKDEWQNMIHKMYAEVYASNPHIYGLWDSWELSKIDPSWDKPYGRISHSFWRENGVIKDITELRSLDGDSELYLETKSTIVPSVNEPYMDVQTAGKSETRLMISLEAPVVKNNQFVAVIAFDITLEQLQDIVLKINPFQGSYAYLISNQGVISGHPNKAYLNKNITEVFPEDTKNNNVEEKIMEGRSFNYFGKNEDGEKIYYSYVPVKIAYTSTPWSVAIAVPIETIMAKANKNFRISLLIGVIGILLMAVIISIISRSITSALNKGVNFAQKVASGNLTATFEIDQSDEVGDLAKALNQMVLKLREIVESVNLSAENISDASREMSSSSQQMSQGANQQASSAEEVSSSMQEMASNIQQNTDNAQQTEKIVLKTADGIKQGSDSSEVSMNAMKEIAEKITIVNDIAFQTNILALNAAVEAARAGEHGKGFAVVAAEVRKLAERSKVAADEIDQLSREGVEVSEKAGRQLKEIVPEIEKTVKLIQEISAASLEQNSGADQINSAVQQLNQVTQQNAASSEELATGSEELASQAEQLKEDISYFKIDNKNTKSVKKEKRTEKIISEKQKIEKSNIKNDDSNTNRGVNLKMYDDKSIDEDYESF